jgi:hypothetical protein
MRPRARRFISTDGYAELVKHALAGSDGLCAAHSGRTDMRELGSRGGKARRAGVVEQLPKPERESLRHHLRAQLDHDVILAAVQQTLAGGNESARVQCIRFLADLELYREEDREQQVGAETARYVERLAQLLRDRGYRQHRAGKSEPAEELTQAARQLWDESETVDGVVVADVSPSDARAVLEGLADLGLIRPPLRPRERDELAEKDAEIARLKTALSEFTAVA